MTPEAVRTPEPEPAQIGAFSRVTGVFFEPGKTFEDIGRKPSWFLPLILMIIAGLAFYITYGQRAGWQRFVDQQVATNARAQQQMERLPPEQRQQQAAVQAKITGMMFYASAVLFVPIVMVISSAILLGLTSMMSAGLRFKQVFAVVCFAGLPMIVKHLLSIVVLFLKNPDDFNVQNPLAFNFAAFMDQATASKFLYTIASAFDLFAIWVIVLTGIGLSAAAGRKRLSAGAGIFAAAAPWIVFVLLGASIAAMAS